MEYQIDQIATLMRYSLGSGEQHTVSLVDEMVAVRAYLAIEQIRFEERRSNSRSPIKVASA